MVDVIGAPARQVIAEFVEQIWRTLVVRVRIGLPRMRPDIRVSPLSADWLRKHHWETAKHDTAL